MPEQLIVIGPTPPPFHGVSVQVDHLVSILRAQGRLAAHVETRDPRPVLSMGTLDLENLRLAIVHTARLARSLRRHPGANVYIAISQGRWGFLRDTLFFLLAFLARRRTFVHLHGGAFREFYRESGPVMRWLIRAALRGTQQAWVLTPSLQHLFDGLVPRQNIRVVENVVDDPMTEALPSPRDSDDGGLRLLFLGHLYDLGKGAPDLLDALDLIAEQGEGWQVRFVGDYDPALGDELRERAAALAQRGITVDFAGPRTGTDKLAELAWADVFVYPSRYRYEGQPLVLLEALGAGLPIVSTRHSGIPDTVRHEHEGLLVEPGDVTALAAAVLRLAHDRALRERLGRQGRARYLERYQVERLARDLDSILGPRNP